MTALLTQSPSDLQFSVVGMVSRSYPVSVLRIGIGLLSIDPSPLIRNNRVIVILTD